MVSLKKPFLLLVVQCLQIYVHDHHWHFRLARQRIADLEPSKQLAQQTTRIIIYIHIFQGTCVYIYIIPTTLVCSFRDHHNVKYHTHAYFLCRIMSRALARSRWHEARTRVTLGISVYAPSALRDRLAQTQHTPRNRLRRLCALYLASCTITIAIALSLPRSLSMYVCLWRLSLRMVCESQSVYYSELHVLKLCAARSRLISPLLTFIPDGLVAAFCCVFTCVDARFFEVHSGR